MKKVWAGIGVLFLLAGCSSPQESRPVSQPVAAEDISAPVLGRYLTSESLPAAGAVLFDDSLETDQHRRNFSPEAELQLSSVLQNRELLLKTGEARYAEELPKTVEWLNRLAPPDSVGIEFAARLSALLLPVVFTRDVDKIFLNLFTDASLEYEHSLGGRVKISQQTEDYSGRKLTVTFELPEKRYIELYVRVPSDAVHPSVVVKKVKYFAQPGSYCQIAKKWKTGDLVEISF